MRQPARIRTRPTRYHHALTPAWPCRRGYAGRRDIGAPFAVDDTGAVLLDELEALRQREQAAAARRNYRLAAQLQDVLAVLEPRSGGRLTLTDCAPSSVEAQHEFFLENGVSGAVDRRPADPRPALTCALHGSSA
eukprot:COSAG05_NODE_7_length_42457_cov_58.929152_9_plen_135_part_00